MLEIQIQLRNSYAQTHDYSGMTLNPGFEAPLISLKTTRK